MQVLSLSLSTTAWWSRNAKSTHSFGSQLAGKHQPHKVPGNMHVISSSMIIIIFLVFFDSEIRILHQTYRMYRYMQVGGFGLPFW